jgi:hypothetical protein
LCGAAVFLSTAIVSVASTRTAAGAHHWNLEASYAAHLSANPNPDGWSYRFSQTLDHPLPRE